MKNFKIYNRTLGWLTFLTAAVVYLMTIEPTTSLWDCGEFIASAYKLEVGHPPGAPLHMIMARVAIFAGNKEMTRGQMIAVLASGLVGAMAYAFSDTFWFSAVEGEVYGTSSLFTAIVFWAILKQVAYSNCISNGIIHWDTFA
jgi:hypothetical protein